MIEILTGTLLHKDPGKVILDCGGVGFSVFISSHTYSALCDTGNKQTLFTFLKVREDDMTLYGFNDRKERELFLDLGTVSGVGTKTALQILSEIRYDRLSSAIATADVTLISQAHGVGKKTAQKIVFELKEKIGNLDGVSALSSVINNTAINSEAVAALVRLGYKNADANTAVGKIIKEKGKDISTQDIIKFALKDRIKK